MRVEKDLFSTLSKILADPEKDWSNHFPIVQLTEEDFSKGEEIIRRHIKSAKSRNESLQKLEEWKRDESRDYRMTQHLGRYQTDYIPFFNFISFLKNECRFRKSWEKKMEISDEIESLFEIKKVNTLIKEVIKPFSRMMTSLEFSRRNYESFLQEKNEILNNPDLLTEEKESWFDLNFGGGN